MVKYYTAAFPHDSWKTAYDFLKDAFSLTLDDDFEANIKVIKISENGYSMVLSVDGDLFCYETITTPYGDVIHRHWQGIQKYKAMSVEQFSDDLLLDLKETIKKYEKH